MSELFEYKGRAYTKKVGNASIGNEWKGPHGLVMVAIGIKKTKLLFELVKVLIITYTDSNDVDLFRGHFICV